ncbi:hypothetical protein ACP4OV_012688 [Aristida adscensionis]
MGPPPPPPRGTATAPSNTPAPPGRRRRRRRRHLPRRVHRLRPLRCRRSPVGRRSPPRSGAGRRAPRLPGQHPARRRAPRQRHRPPVPRRGPRCPRRHRLLSDDDLGPLYDLLIDEPPMIRRASWPTFVLIGPNGKVLSQISGEGHKKCVTRTSFAQPSGISLAPGIVKPFLLHVYNLMPLSIRLMRTIPPESQEFFVADSESSSIRAVNLKTGGSRLLAGGDPVFPENLFRFGDYDGTCTTTTSLGCCLCQQQPNICSRFLQSQDKKARSGHKKSYTIAGTGRAGYRDVPGLSSQLVEEVSEESVCHDPGSSSAHYGLTGESDYCDSSAIFLIDRQEPSSGDFKRNHIEVQLNQKKPGRSERFKQTSADSGGETPVSSHSVSPSDQSVNIIHFCVKRLTKAGLSAQITSCSKKASIEQSEEKMVLSGDGYERNLNGSSNKRLDPVTRKVTTIAGTGRAGYRDGPGKSVSKQGLTCVTLSNIIQRNFPEEYAEMRSEHETTAYAGVDLMPLFVMDVVLPCQKMALNIFEPRYRLMVKMSQNLDMLVRCIWNLLMVRRIMEGNHRMGMVAIDSATGTVADCGCEVIHLFCMLFMHPYHDVDPEIRMSCIKSLGIWVVSYPSIFLQNIYLKYLGLTLNDKNAGVRRTSVLALQSLYAVDDNISLRGLFTDKFYKRMIQLADDIDISVAVSAIGLIKQLLRHQLLSDDDLGPLYDLLIDEPPMIRRASWPTFVLIEPNGKFLSQVKGTEGYTQVDTIDGYLFRIRKKRWLVILLDSTKI